MTGVVLFSRDIRPLFRPDDIQAMWFMLDLGSVHEVRTHAGAIYASVEEGSMPCDEPWSPEAVDLLKRWIEGGMVD